MPANILERDVQVGLEMAWHGATKVVDEVTFEDAFPFEIERKPLYVDKSETPLKGWEYFRCTDDGKMAGKPVSDSYSALTNRRFWEIVQNSVGGSGAKIESAGTIFDRCRRFVTVKLNTGLDDFKVGERVFKNRFSLLDSIDGSTNFYGVNSSTCVVCSNTFQLVMGDTSGEFRFKIRHTNGLISAIEGMEKAIDSFVGVAAQFQAALKIANETPVQIQEARNLFAGWIGNSTGGMSTVSYNAVSRLTDLFKGGAGNRGETLLDAFSAVTDYYSHESSRGENQPDFRRKQYLSSEFGSASKKKQDFFNNLFIAKKRTDIPVFNRDNYSKLVSNGRSLLTAADMVVSSN